MPQAVYILFGAVLTAAVSLACGSILLSRVSVDWQPGEKTLFSFVCGSAILSTIVFLFCTFGVARKGVFLGTGLFLCVLGWRGLRVSLPRIPFPWWIVYAVFGVLYLSNAMTPEHSPDGMTYHLGLVARY